MNIAILGAGNIAQSMAITLQPLKGVTCYAVASRDRKKAQAFADKYGFEVAYGSYTEMLNEARQIATKRMVDEAKALGADAVVGVKYGSSQIMQTAAEIVAYGTAVKFK